MATSCRIGGDRGSNIHSMGVELVWCSVPMRRVECTAYNVLSLEFGMEFEKL